LIVGAGGGLPTVRLLGVIEDPAAVAAQLVETMGTADLWELYRRDITVISSYSPAPAELHESLELLRRPGFALEQLVQRQVALDQINDGMELARTQQAIKVLVRLS